MGGNQLISKSKNKKQVCNILFNKSISFPVINPVISIESMHLFISIYIYI